MSEIFHAKATDVQREHKNDHEGYEFFRRSLIPKGFAKDCTVALYEIPPGKSAHPYHYHIKNEESFYILSGKGILKTPKGNKEVSAGEFIFFPASVNGAHKLTNISKTEPLVYLDFDTSNDLEVAVYPDSGKVGIFGSTLRQIYKTSDQVDYYKDE